MQTRCPICGADDIYTLPIPAPRRAVLSDGRIVSRNLAKRGCRACGATTHVDPPTEAELNAFYDAGYLLTGSAPATSKFRALTYANWITEVLGRLGDSTLLEVGCGAGHLLEALANRHPDIKALGLDPSLPRDRVSTDKRLSFRRGRLEFLPGHSAEFDLAMAINVIEHTPDAVHFLRCLGTNLRDHGRIVLIVPDFDPPNSELLFFDHITTFSPTALETVAARSELQLLLHHTSSKTVGNFQMFVLKKTEGVNNNENSLHSSELERRRVSYLEAWRNLDSNLACRTSDYPILRMFGAAETAALIRAYAPSVWDRIELLTLDPPAEPWALDRPVVIYDRLKPNHDHAIILATPPGSQANLAERLSRDGHSPVIWEDFIPTRGALRTA